MSQPLKPASQRVQDFLAERGLALQVMQLPQATGTAAEAAQAVGCAISQIAKSLVFKDASTGAAILVVASGQHRVSLTKVTAATGLHLEKANAAFVRERTGYAIGGVPPVAHTTHLVTLLDQDLRQHASIWAAAGTPNSLFELAVADLEALTHGTWLDLAESP